MRMKNKMKKRGQFQIISLISKIWAFILANWQFILALVILYLILRQIQ